MTVHFYVAPYNHLEHDYDLTVVLWWRSSSLLRLEETEAEKTYPSRIECGGIEADEGDLPEPGRSSDIQK